MWCCQDGQWLWLLERQAAKQFSSFLLNGGRFFEEDPKRWCCQQRFMRKGALLGTICSVFNGPFEVCTFLMVFKTVMLNELMEQFATLLKSDPSLEKGSERSKVHGLQRDRQSTCASTDHSRREPSILGVEKAKIRKLGMKLGFL